VIDNFRLIEVGENLLRIPITWEVLAERPEIGNGGGSDMVTIQFRAAENEGTD
jgi:hypothetical protein